MVIKKARLSENALLYNALYVQQVHENVTFAFVSCVQRKKMPAHEVEVDWWSKYYASKGEGDKSMNYDEQGYDKLQAIIVTYLLALPVRPSYKLTNCTRKINIITAIH